MLFMIIEKFHPGKVKNLYQRFEEKGRLMPEGVIYINSWIDTKINTCYQVMESDSEIKINEWISNWNDLADFEVIPVITSAQAKEIVFSN
jgi:2-hydroxy-3-keto-5-methylthiopentenyl-1-phosphate phosphatase